MQHQKTLTTFEYGEKLEKLGLLEIGEPLVYRQIASNNDYIFCYLEYNEHKTHLPIAVTTAASSENEKKNFIFDDVKDPLPLTDFIQENKNLKIVDFEVPLQKEALRTVGSNSMRKALTWMLAKKILNLDKGKTELEKQQQERAVTSLLKYSVNAIGKPEQVAYLSRLQSITLEEQDELVNLPMDWMVKSLRYERPNVSITLPWIDSIPETYAPYERCRL
jgi:hypothetical protein